MIDNARCIVMVPTTTGLPLPECEERLRVLERRGYPVWRARGFAYLDTALSKLATDALAQGFDDLLWIGPDIVFDPDAVDALRASDQPIVGGLYPQPTEGRYAVELPKGTGLIRFGPAGGLVELRYSGFGFMLTRRSVYESIRAQLKLPICNERAGIPLVPYFASLIVARANGEARYLEGEHAFCERSRQCGFRVMGDTRIDLRRLGQYNYGREDVCSGTKRIANRPARERPSQSRQPEVDAEPAAVVVPSKEASANPAAPPMLARPPRHPLRESVSPLGREFPRLEAYMVTYPANRESAQRTLEDFRKSDWRTEPTVVVQPADWKPGFQNSARNYKRALEQAVADQCDFALFLEDDVRVNRHLRHNLETLPLIARDQCDYLSLYIPDLISHPWEREEAHLGYRLAKPLYSGPNQLWERHRLWGVQACLFSRRFLVAALERWDRLKEGQDTRIISVCSELQLSMYYTAPCLVQHAPVRSAFSTPVAFAPDFDAEFRLRIQPGFQPPEDIPGWLTYEEGHLLWQIAANRTVLEMGTACGRSTVCSAQQARSVVCIDLQDQSEAAEWLHRYGLSERVTLKQGDSVERCRELEGPFGLAFIDTEHDAASVARDIEAALPLLEPNALVAFHDYPDPGWPDVRKVVDDYAARLGWRRVAQAGYLGVFQTMR